MKYENMNLSRYKDMFYNQFIYLCKCENDYEFS